MVDYIGVGFYAWLLGCALVGMVAAERQHTRRVLSCLGAMLGAVLALDFVPNTNMVAGIYESEYIDNYMARALIGGWDPIANQLKMSAESGVVRDNSLVTLVCIFAILVLIGVWWAIASANR